MSLAVVLAAIQHTERHPGKFDYEITMADGSGFSCDTIEAFDMKTDGISKGIYARAIVTGHGKLSQMQFLNPDYIMRVVPRPI